MRKLFATLLSVAVLLALALGHRPPRPWAPTVL